MREEKGCGMGESKAPLFLDHFSLGSLTLSALQATEPLSHQAQQYIGVRRIIGRGFETQSFKRQISEILALRR